MSNRIPWLVSALILACGVAQNAPQRITDVTGNCKFPDGSNSCDAGPVLAIELAGLWCEENNAECLLVEPREQISGDQRSKRMHYVRYSDSCLEQGWLSGGLEFWPTTANCDRPPNELAMYAVSVDWTETGIAVFYDDRRVQQFTYMGE